MPYKDLENFQHPWKNRSDIYQAFPDSDRELVRSGLEKLVTELSLLSNAELPNVIIYAETSARPLAFAVSPVLDKIYLSRGLNKPPGFYFQSFSGFVFERDASDRRIYGKDNYQELAKEDDRKTFSEIYKDNPKEFEKFMTARENREEEVNKKRALMDARAAEITSQLKDMRSLRILLVDDYSKVERTTIIEVYKAFKKQSPSLRMTAFAFLSGISYEDPQYLTEDELNESNTLAEIPNFKLIIGNFDPKTKRHSDRGPILSTHGFMYRHPDDPLTGGSTQAEKIIGFAKNTTLSKAEISLQRDPDLMLSLQKAMQQIGEQVAQNLNDHKQ